MHERALSSSLVKSQTAIASADRSATVVTRMVFRASPAQVWQHLMFYEQLDERPPFYLRWLLPVPQRTVGSKSQVGDEALCLYVGGHLVKRVTRIEHERLYAFEVIEQKLDVGGGMQLCDGSYVLRPLPDGTTEVSTSTHYISKRAPRWLWRRIEATVCHTFHRHILRAMRTKVCAK